jgi:hypothetical protein
MHILNEILIFFIGILYYSLLLLFTYLEKIIHKTFIIAFGWFILKTSVKIKVIKTFIDAYIVYKLYSHNI